MSQKYLTRVDGAFAECTKLNSQLISCYSNYAIPYVKAARQAFHSGRDPQPLLVHALKNFAIARELGGGVLDAEQQTAMAYLIDAAERVRRGQDPGPAQGQLLAALGRCFALAAADATCRTLAAQAEWVTADWLALKNQPATPALERALKKAVLATQSSDVDPDRWQVLAETRLRLGRAAFNRPAVRDAHLLAGLIAVEQVFTINPNHALGRSTQGALLLLRAESLRDTSARRKNAASAAQALAQALTQDPFLSHLYEPLRAQAQRLAADH